MAHRIKADISLCLKSNSSQKGEAKSWLASIIQQSLAYLIIIKDWPLPKVTLGESLITIDLCCWIIKRFWENAQLALP